MSVVQLSEISLAFGQIRILSDVNLAVREGEYVVVLGESGCGKTSLLRMIAGLVRPTSGHIFLGNTDVTRVPPRKRDVALVPQQAGIYPHLTVGQSIAMGIRERLSPSERQQRVTQAAGRVGLETLLDRRPHQLSGGQLRRAALAKAIATAATVRLLDEPLAAIDAQMQFRIEDDLRELHQSTGGATLHVTHDGAEAMRLADRIAVISEGRIAQYSSPAEIQRTPATAQVAALIGSSPFCTLRIEKQNGRWRTEKGQVVDPADFRELSSPPEGSSGVIGYYRADIQTVEPGESTAGWLDVETETTGGRTKKVRPQAIHWFND